MTAAGRIFPVFVGFMNSGQKTHESVIPAVA